MSKKGENIYKRNDGRWEGRILKYYTEGGKKKFAYFYGTTYKEVKTKMNEFKQQDLRFDNINSASSFDSIIDAWLQSQKSGVKESTYARYYNIVKNHIKPYLGIYPICGISRRLFEWYINQLLSNGRVDKTGGLSKKTVSDIIIVIKSIFRYADKINICHIFNDRSIPLKRIEKEIRVLDVMEEHDLFDYLISNIDRYKFGVLVSLFTGIRIGELCALKWEDVDLKQKSFFIHNTIQRITNIDESAVNKTKVIITEPKTQYSIRRIPIPDMLISWFVLFKSSPENYLLSGSSCFVEPRTMQYHFHKYVMSAGIKDANYHSLRHTFATRCIEAGVDIKTLSEILGHSSVNITLNRYVHPSFETKKNEINRAAEMFKPSNKPSFIC